MAFVRPESDAGGISSFTTVTGRDIDSTWEGDIAGFGRRVSSCCAFGSPNRASLRSFLL